ncbi:hypothetical protein [Sulfitobacter sp. W002]|uniref:hypothetical protein n=1 Tax=Sulfitobacter sp. W002 TaxID=2867024 RepID=UPI0021A2E4CE|nr:hypothetical protein [Sulfitobacter sp. W002]
MLQFILDTLIRSLDLALIAVALSAVYSLINFPNVALVQYAVAGAFAGMMLSAWGLPIWLAVIISAGGGL